MADHSDFGPDFNDDFLEEYITTGDYFEEDDYQVSTVKHVPKEVRKPDAVKKSRNPSSQKSGHSYDLPIGNHPLDWFVNAEFDSSIAKRKQERLAEIKSSSIVYKITSKKEQVQKEQAEKRQIEDEQIEKERIELEQVENERPTLTYEPPVLEARYLRDRPTDGSKFYEFSSPDCYYVGYIKVNESAMVLKRPAKKPMNRCLDTFGSLLDTAPSATEL